MNKEPNGSDPVERLVSEMKTQCNRYANGYCQTLACLQRGGYKKGDIPNHDISTCEKHEQIMAIESLIDNGGGKQSDDYERSDAGGTSA